MHPEHPQHKAYELPDRAVRIVFPSTPISVRAALKRALQALADLRLSRHERDTVELVLAEVMNNVCEHAYRGSSDGLIGLQVERDGAGLLCQVLDDGLPMPGGEPPGGLPVDLDRSPHELPEGGFGWFLLRELTSDLAYHRIDGRNRLSFRLRVGIPSAPISSAHG